MLENVAQLLLNIGQFLWTGDRKGLANGASSRFIEMVNGENPSEMRSSCLWFRGICGVFSACTEFFLNIGTKLATNCIIVLRHAKFEGDRDRERQEIRRNTVFDRGLCLGISCFLKRCNHFSKALVYYVALVNRLIF